MNGARVIYASVKDMKEWQVGEVVKFTHTLGCRVRDKDGHVDLGEGVRKGSTDRWRGEL